MSTTLSERGAARKADWAKQVRILEEHAARKLNVSVAIAFGYARHALIGILEAVGLQPGDEVILSPLTCKVVPLALLSLQLKPVYADISVETLNLDPRAIEAVAGPASRALLFQHTYGNTAGIEEASGIAERKKLFLIEDCAQCMPYATGCYRPGSHGQGAIFSQNLMKPLPAGSGGMAVTGDPLLAERIRSNRNDLPALSWSGDFRLRAEKWIQERLLRPEWYWPLFDLYRRISPGYRRRAIEAEIESEIMGTRHRPSPRQIRLGENWLSRVEMVAEHRRRSCLEYGEALRNTRVQSPQLVDPSQPLYYYPVLASDKRALLQAARSHRIELIAWPVSVPIYPLERLEDMRPYGYEPGSCRVAEEVAGKLIGLPTHDMIVPGYRRRIIDFLLGSDI